MAKYTSKGAEPAGEYTRIPDIEAPAPKDDILDEDEDQVEMPGWCCFCLFYSKNTIEGYKATGGCILCLVVTFLVLLVIIVVTQALPTGATVLSWYYWQDNSDLYDKHPSANDIALNLFVWNLAQIGAILAGIVLIFLIVMFLSCVVNIFGLCVECCNECNNQIEYEREMMKEDKLKAIREKRELREKLQQEMEDMRHRQEDKREAEM